MLVLPNRPLETVVFSEATRDETTTFIKQQLGDKLEDLGLDEPTLHKKIG